MVLFLCDAVVAFGLSVGLVGFFVLFVIFVFLLACFEFEYSLSSLEHFSTFK